MSPSQARRNQRRKEDSLKSKTSQSENSSKEVTTDAICENKQEHFLKRKKFPSVESSKEVTTDPVSKTSRNQLVLLSVTYVTKHSKQNTS